MTGQTRPMRRLWKMWIRNGSMWSWLPMAMCLSGRSVKFSMLSDITASLFSTETRPTPTNTRVRPGGASLNYAQKGMRFPTVPTAVSAGGGDD